MEAKNITREHIERHLDNYRKRINEKLPKFAAISAIEIQEEEFEKTPKRSIRRYLYK
jgi:long-chain acyl-CoA synthetase